MDKATTYYLVRKGTNQRYRKDGDVVMVHEDEVSGVVGEQNQHSKEIHARLNPGMAYRPYEAMSVQEFEEKYGRDE